MCDRSVYISCFSFVPIHSVPKHWWHLTSNSFSKLLVPFAIRRGFGAKMVPVFWNKFEERLVRVGVEWHMESNGTSIEGRLFRGAEVVTTYVSFQQVPLIEFPSNFLHSTPRA